MKRLLTLLALVLGAPSLALAQTADFNLPGPSTNPGSPQITVNSLSGAVNSSLRNKADLATSQPRIANPFTYGVLNTAAGASIVSNSTHPAQIMNGIQGSGKAGYPGFDSVGLYLDITAPPYSFSASALTFDATHAYFTPALTPGQVAQLRVGMYMVTSESTPHQAQIQGWATDGSSVTTDVWFTAGHPSAGPPTVPATVNFNPITSIYSENVATFLPLGSPVTSSRIAEDDIWNYIPITPGANATLDQPHVQGIDITTTGPQGGSDAFSARGVFRDGFLNETGSEAGYLYDPTIQNMTPATLGGFVARQNSNLGFNLINAASGTSVFSVDAQAGATTTGNQTVTGSVTASGKISTTSGLGMNAQVFTGVAPANTNLGVAGSSGSAVVNLGATHDGATQFVSSVSAGTGGTVTLLGNRDGLYLENASTISTFTVLLPPITTTPGQTFWIASLGGVNTITVKDSTGAAITGALTVIAAGKSISFICDGTTWFPK